MRGITKRVDQLEATARARYSDFADWSDEQLATRLAEMCDELEAAGCELPAELSELLARHAKAVPA